MTLEPTQPAATIISLDAHRQTRRLKPADTLRLLALFTACVFGFIGSFADTAVARTTLMLIESPGDIDGSGLASTVMWAIMVNIAVCAAILLLGYMALSRPQAKVIRIDASRRDSDLKRAGRR